MHEPRPNPPSSGLHGLIDEIAWDQLEHHRGNARDVPDLLCILRSASDSRTGAVALADLDDLLYHQGGWVCSAATAALPILVGLAAAPGFRHRAVVVALLGDLAEVTRTAEEKFIDPGWPQAWAAALPTLMHLCEDTDPAVRRAVCATVARTSTALDDVALVLRQRWSQETDPSCRVDLLYCLGDLLRPHPRVQAPEALVRDVRDWLASLLAAPGVPGVPGSGVPGADGSAQGLPPHLVLAASVALRWLSPDEPTDLTARNRLVAALRTTDHTELHGDTWVAPDPVARIAHTLGEFAGEPDLQAAVIAHLIDDPSPTTRRGAVRAATQLLSLWRSPETDLVPLLARRLTDPDPPTRAGATYLLGCLGAVAGEHAGAIAALLSDHHPTGARGDTRISDVAIFALARMGDDRCVPVLARRLEGSATGGRPWRSSSRRTRLGFDVESVHYGRALPLDRLPGIQDVLAWLPDHVDALLPGVRRHLRTATSTGERLAFCRVVTTWGPAAAMAEPELRALLGGDAALSAAEALASVTGASHRDRTSRSRSQPDGAPTSTVDLDALRRELSAAAPWTRVRAAHALWQAGGDPCEAVPVLTAVLETATGQEALPVTVAAAEYLADIARTHPGPVVTAARSAAERITADERRLAYFGGWRAFLDDEALRRHAREILRHSSGSRADA